jgi:6-phosphogluconolactonase (cycloisomerase 2 family)
MYSIDAGTGVLAKLSGSPLKTSSNTEAVAVDPAGTFLFAANAVNDLTSYGISSASGELTLVSTVASGTFPSNVVIDPAGTFAYVANQRSDNVSVYAINATTGALTEVSGSPFATGVNPRSIAIY